MDTENRGRLLPPQRGRRYTSRIAVVAAVVLRLIAVLLSAELSGTVHAAIDTAAAMTWIAHPQDDCDDEAGHECPPGCLNCHCAHSGIAVTASTIDVRPEAVPSEIRDRGVVPLSELPPRGTDLPSLYRPPRTAFAV